jgi:thiol-disulfide isomerase/thioredoxin
MAMTLALGLGAASCSRVKAARADTTEEESLAPELEGGLAWLNTDRPLKLSELRGQVVVLDFWTYCCINCMHVLPILHDLEQKHASDPVVVIGVHSAKFQGERDPDRIREAMARYGVTHPVYVDDDMHVWNAYGVSSWPTIVVIRPNGRLAAMVGGEPDPAKLDAFIGQVMAQARADGTLAKAPVVIHRPPEADTGPLSFPGKVQAAPDGRIFVSDSGHHRVLVLAADGQVLDTIGSGLSGVRTGAFGDAAFKDPEGLALDGDQLYIADARGHVIVRADLKARTVTRVAGLGELGLEPLGSAQPALQTALRSPWALVRDGRRLFFTVAGSHQIGVFDLDGGTVARFAGNGREAIVDGGADDASFAQPSELTLHDGTLYVADSESSGVRAVDLKTRVTRTVIGTGLFDFGDTDGPVKSARLQHPLGVAWTSDGLAVADTYNNKVKLLLPDLSGIKALSITVGGKAPFEPGGLAVAADGSLLVADTDNHRILRVPRQSGHLVTASAVAISVQGAPAPPSGIVAAEGAAAAPPPITGPFSAELPATAIGEGARRVSLTLTAPSDFELTKDAPYEVRVESADKTPGITVGTDRFRGHQQDGVLRVDVPLQVAKGDSRHATLVALVHAVICDAKTHRACYPVENLFKLSLALGGGSADAAFATTLAPPRH